MNEDMDVEAAVDAAATASGEKYIELRDAVVKRGPSVVKRLSRIADGAKPGAALIARAWRGWIESREDFESILRSFDVEESLAPQMHVGQTPQPGRVSESIRWQIGPVAAPLLGELLWKTGASWPTWRRNACFQALALLEKASEATLRELHAIAESGEMKKTLEDVAAYAHIKLKP